jgi:putative hemolysin
MNSQTIYLLLSFILLLFDLVTIAARAGLRNANLARLLQMRVAMPVQVDRARTFIQSLSRPYAALHTFQSLVRVLMLVLIFLLFGFGNPDRMMVVVVAITLLIGLLVAWLEWMVERLVTRNPETWVLRLTLFIQVMMVLLYPFVLVSLILSREWFNPPPSTGTVTEDELKTLVDAGQQEGVLEQEERQMIYSIFQLGDTLTREIMVPRIDVLALDVNSPLEEAVDALLTSGYSRVPVYEDTIDNILGVLYGKDLLKVWRQENGQLESLRAVLREPYFIPEAKKVDELLAEMQSKHVHMAIVVDEYGGVAGVVTLEDIIEEIFGEIQDEYDQEEQPYQVLTDGDYIFRGRIDLDDFNQIMDTTLPVDEADTLGGFIYTRLGHVPMAGESVEEDGLLLTVELVSSRRIRKVRAQRNS